MNFVNQANYDSLYSEGKAFLRWPADWILRFNNMFLNDRLPKNARMLDFGCGSGNNAIPFLKQSYEVHGVDVAPSSKELVEKNLEFHGLGRDFSDRLVILSPPLLSLPYEDNYFDFVLSNQVHYYSKSEAELHSLNSELLRIMKPGGVIFVTMMGPKNYYITKWSKPNPVNGVYEVRIDDPAHRLAGVSEDILLVESEEELLRMFAEFEPETTGYFDQSMFDLDSNFHWIFVGVKPDS